MAITQRPSTNSAEIYREAQNWLDRLHAEPQKLALATEERRRLADLLEQMLVRLDCAEAITGIRHGLEQSEQGLARDARTVLAELRQKLKIPDSY